MWWGKTLKGLSRYLEKYWMDFSQTYTKHALRDRGEHVKFGVKKAVYQRPRGGGVKYTGNVI